MWYTGKGDKGKTDLFGSKKRIDKTSPIIGGLGSLDELNACVGLFRARYNQLNDSFEIRGEEKDIPDILYDIQNDIYTIQAELASEEISKSAVKNTRLDFLEEIIDSVDGHLPHVESFLVPGANEKTAFMDLLRTVTRRVERAVLSASKKKSLSQTSLSYLNRLSSVFYVLARYFAYVSGNKENPPKYNQD